MYKNVRGKVIMEILTFDLSQIGVTYTNSAQLWENNESV